MAIDTGATILSGRAWFEHSSTFRTRVGINAGICIDRGAARVSPDHLRSGPVAHKWPFLGASARARAPSPKAMTLPIQLSSINGLTVCTRRSCEAAFLDRHARLLSGAASVAGPMSDNGFSAIVPRQIPTRHTSCLSAVFRCSGAHGVPGCPVAKFAFGCRHGDVSVGVALRGRFGLPRLGQLAPRRLAHL